MPGVPHDLCSAVHPFGVASPFLSSLPLAEHGLVWRWPEVDLAHPLDDGSAGVMLRSLDETWPGSAPTGRPGAGPSPRWSRLRRPGRGRPGPGPPLAGPPGPDGAVRAAGRAARHPLRQRVPHAAGQGAVRRLGGARVPPARPARDRVGRRDALRGRSPHGLAGGGGRLGRHHEGAASLLRAGRHDRHRTVSSGPTCPPPGSPSSTPARRGRAILGDALPGRTRRAYRRWKYGPGAFKVDLAVRGGVPWTAEPHAGRHGPPRRHPRGDRRGRGGDLRRADAGAPVRPGGAAVPRRPHAVGGDVHPVWAYAHVPDGWDGPGERGRPRPARALRPRAPGPDRGDRGADPGRVRGRQPQLRRRRHRRRRQRPAPARGPAPVPRTPTPRACPASTCARRRPRRARACTACAATGRPPARSPTSDERADRLDRLVDLVGVGGDARAEPYVRRRVRRRAAHHPAAGAGGPPPAAAAPRPRSRRCPRRPRGRTAS